MLRDKLVEAGKMSQSMKDSTTSEQSLENQELKDEDHIPARVPQRQRKIGR